MRLRRTAIAALIVLAALASSGRASAQQPIILTVHIRDAAGHPVVGVGVHLYRDNVVTATLVADQIADATGSVRFSVVPHGAYSVALYAPSGFPHPLLPEDQQYLPGAGDLGIHGVVGIGVVMGEKDYTLRLVLQGDRPYHDRSPSDRELPEPYIPGVTDKNWPTPTPYGFAAGPGSPTAAATPGPTGAAAPTPSGAAAPTPPRGGAVQPTPFPWGPALVVAGICGAGAMLYNLYSRGRLQQWLQQWRKWRRSRKRSPKSGG